MKSEPDHSQEKAQIRQRIRQARTALSASDRMQMDQTINDSILAWVKTNACSVIGAYVAFDGEPSLLPAMETLLGWDCVVVLPVVTEATGPATIEFRQWSATTGMKPNRYGIPEPQGTPAVHANDLDLVLVPLVGWDIRGRRLGMGAGFYDRYFNPWADQALPVRAGVAYELQKQDALPADPWDISLHQVFTENGLTTF